MTGPYSRYDSGPAKSSSTEPAQQCEQVSELSTEFIEKSICFVSETDMHVEVGDFVYKEDPYRKLRPWIYEINWRELDENPISEIIDEIEGTEPVSPKTDE
jgi:hypothetical protein